MHCVCDFAGRIFPDGNPYALLLALVISFVDLLPILGTGTILVRLSPKDLIVLCT